MQFTAGNNKVCPVRNISKDTYLDLKTGKVKEKKKSENRYQSPKSVRKSINRLMDLIRCNATDSAKCKWITVAEPQGERHGNSWHLHILLIFEDTAPFIANETIAEIWSHGITSTHAVFDGDGLALYFKAYLSDIEYEENIYLRNPGYLRGDTGSK